MEQNNPGVGSQVFTLYLNSDWFNPEKTLAEFEEELRVLKEKRYVRWWYSESNNTWVLYNYYSLGDMMTFNADYYTLPEALIKFNKEIYNYEYYGKL